MRKCIACEKEDTAPKHVMAIADGTNGGADVFWHMDCHATATGCEACATVVEESGGAKDDALVEHLTGEAP
jgi:hypothetical protein